MASSHLCSGTWERSITVPVRQMNLPRQALQRNMPACVLPSMRWTLTPPQSGQVTPFGQREASIHSRAASSSWKRGSERLVMAECSCVVCSGNFGETRLTNAEWLAVLGPIHRQSGDTAVLGLIERLERGRHDDRPSQNSVDPR